ncbi:MAG: hypothetical protein JWO05_1944 [Gemmatimonadetes bacterium]|nr:hypothetical protein [Gemmatimonadota bacterium]
MASAKKKGRAAVRGKAKPKPRARAKKRVKVKAKKQAKVKVKAKAPAVAMRMIDLDPVRKCGPATSVERLIRVVEKKDAEVVNHLVFLDRHGWYCEHGRGCPAVAPARKHAGRAYR